MATAIYTHQPPANYSSYHALALAPQHHHSQYPSSSSSSSSSAHHHSSSKSSKMHKETREQREHREMRERGYRLCDQCGAVENPAVARFRLCGGCMTTQYCSQDCQKAHWASHKAICQHTVAQQQPSHPSHSHSHSSSSSYNHQESYAEQYEETVKALRKYTSTHTALLGWAGFQALRLKKVPANIRHSVLVINLTHSPSPSHHHPHTRPTARPHPTFSFHSTQILPLSSYLTDPLILADITRRAQRSRASGGVGCLIVVLRVVPYGADIDAPSKGGEINQVVPVEVDRVEGIQWAERADWEGVLREGLESGRTFRV